MRRALLAVRGESTSGRVASAALLVVDGVPRHRLPPRALRSPHFHSPIWKFARSGTLRVNTHARGSLYFHHGLLALSIACCAALSSGPPAACAQTLADEVRALRLELERLRQEVETLKSELRRAPARPAAPAAPPAQEAPGAEIIPVLQA